MDGYVRALRLAGANRQEEALTILTDVVQQDPSFTRAYNRIITWNQKLGRAENARDLFESIARETPYGHYGLLLWHREQRNAEQTDRLASLLIEQLPAYLPPYRELVDAARVTGTLTAVEARLQSLLSDNAHRAGAAYALAYMYALRKNRDSAGDYLRRADELLPDQWEIIAALYSVHHQASRNADALSALRRMLALATAEGDKERAAITHGHMGIVHNEVGEYDAAVSHLTAALEWRTASGDRRAEQIHRGHLGLVYIHLARYAEALEQCRTAVRLADELGLKTDKERNLALLARIHAETADYPKAVELFEEAIKLAREVSDRTGEADHLARLAHVYASIGDYERGLAAAERGLQIAREARNEWIEGRLLESQGILYTRLGRRQDALQALERGVSIARKLGDRYGEAARLASVSAARAAAGERTVALQGYGAALSIASEIGAKILEGDIHNAVGKLHLERGDVRGAIHTYRAALLSGRETRMPAVIWRAYAGLAASEEKSGRTAEAITHYREAIQQIELIRGRLPLTEDRATFLDDKIAVYRRLVRLLAISNPPEAFEYSERARARALVDGLAESAMAPDGAGVPAEMLHALRRSEAKLSAVQANLMTQYSRSSVNSALVRRLSMELSDAAEEHDRVRRQIRRASPRYAGFSYPAPVTLKQAQSLLGARTLLLSYLLETDGSLLFALTRDRFHVYPLRGSAAIERRVRALRAAIAAGPSRTALGGFVEDSNALYRDLLSPATGLLTQASELILVPDGPLHYLPFEVLLRPENGTRPVWHELPYLTRTWTTRYTPSVTVLETLKQRPNARPDHVLLAYGDAAYLSPPAGDGRRALRFENLRAGFPLLAESGREVRNIARFYPPAHTSVFTGSEVSEQNIRNAALDRYRVLHFALHAITDERQPQFSALVLSQTSRGAGEDGLLQAYEISALRLNARLVVLSACETALGKQTRGEGLAALSNSFLSAGASAVIASLWKVHDRSTTEYMIRFHRRLSAARAGAAQALRSARLDLISGRTWAHPYYWAPFVLTGHSVSLGR